MIDSPQDEPEAIDADAVNTPGLPEVPAGIADEVSQAEAEQAAEKAFLQANANIPSP